MAQRIYNVFEQQDSTQLLNMMLFGTVVPGVYNGFDFVPPGMSVTSMQLVLSPATTGVGAVDIDINAYKVGTIYTKQGSKIEETGNRTLPIAITTTQPRRDLIVCAHVYEEIPEGSAAYYSVVQGTPGSGAPAPAMPVDTTTAVYTLVGTLYLPAGTTSLNQAGVIWSKAVRPELGGIATKFTSSDNTVEATVIDALSTLRTTKNIQPGTPLIDINLACPTFTTMETLNAFRNGMFRFNGTATVQHYGEDYTGQFTTWAGISVCTANNLRWQIMMGITEDEPGVYPHKVLYRLGDNANGLADEWQAVTLANNEPIVKSTNGTIKVTTSEMPAVPGRREQDIALDVALLSPFQFADLSLMRETGTYVGITPVLNPGEYVGGGSTLFIQAFPLYNIASSYGDGAKVFYPATGFIYSANGSLGPGVTPADGASWTNLGNNGGNANTYYLLEVLNTVNTVQGIVQRLNKQRITLLNGVGGHEEWTRIITKANAGSVVAYRWANSAIDISAVPILN